MKKLLNNMNFREILSQAGLPEQGSNRGYKPEELIEVFMTGIWCGAVKYSDLEIVRGDELLGGILRVRKIGGHKSFIRYFRKFTEAKNIEVFTRLNKWFFSNLKKESITLDVDSTVLERYGTQQGSMKGYSDRKRGRNSHHPILAMIPEERKVVNFWLRSGNTNTANNFISFFENTLERLEGKKVGLLRADSGFFSDKILTFLEEREKPVNYILAVRLYKPLKRLILRDAEFVSVTRGVEMAEIYTSLGGWKKKRRFIIVRQNTKLRPKATGKTIQSSLFPELNLDDTYRYGMIVTNLDLPSEYVWRLYRDRANCENMIKELKHDFGIGSFCTQSFAATEATLNFVLLAYNIMSLFRDLYLKSKPTPMMKQIRKMIISMGATIVSRGRTKYLKLSISANRRQWFKSLWDTEYNLDLPPLL